MIIGPHFSNKTLSKQCKNSFNDHMMKSTQWVKDLYGGIIIFHGKAISFNGLQNTPMDVCNINSGAHANLHYAGDNLHSILRF